MASSVNAAICAMMASAFWALLGYALARHLLPRVLAISAAPIVGWAIQSAATLPIFVLVGFSFAAVTSVAVLCVAGSLAEIFLRKAPIETEAAVIPVWAYAAAAALALVPAAAIAPKISADVVQLAVPIFDHSKVAIIDAMVRLGLPPANPFFGEYGEWGRLAYYYLWYFSAAQAALVLGVSGWEADIAMTWFAAFSSLTLMMGLAVTLSKRSSAAIWVVILACATSLRELIWTIFGAERVDAVLAQSTGFSGWLFQAAWVPQHLTAASCVLVAMLIMSQYARRQTLALTAALVLVITAGFECSTYVGGVTFAIAALFAVPIFHFRIERSRRLAFVLGIFAVALLATWMAAPLILDQISAVGQRGTSAPIVIQHFEVLSDALPHLLRRLLDLPAYWLILLPIEFPATFIAGTLALIILLRTRLPEFERSTTEAFAALALAGLAISWLLVSALGGNNDLGLRAVLPSAMVLIVAAAAGMVLQPRRIVIVATAIGGLALSLPHTVRMIHYNAVGDAVADAKVFAQTPEMWAAVRRHAEPHSRVGNNPLFLKDMTPWPVNISWALLADRSSCFAGHDLVLAYAPMPRQRREAINAQFIRVFEGKGTAEDISDLARKYACDIVVVTAQDKAWDADPFAASALYRLAETKPGRWRIYRVAADSVPSGARGR